MLPVNTNANSTLRRYFIISRPSLADCLIAPQDRQTFTAKGRPCRRAQDTQRIAGRGSNSESFSEPRRICTTDCLLESSKTRQHGDACLRMFCMQSEGRGLIAGIL